MPFVNIVHFRKHAKAFHHIYKLIFTNTYTIYLLNEYGFCVAQFTKATTIHILRLLYKWCWFALVCMLCFGFRSQSLKVFTHALDVYQFDISNMVSVGFSNNTQNCQLNELQYGFSNIFVNIYQREGFVCIIFSRTRKINYAWGSIFFSADSFFFREKKIVGDIFVLVKCKESTKFSRIYFGI